MATKDDVLTVLQSHIGAGNGIGGDDLARKLGTSTRDLRSLTGELIDDGVALCSHPSRGYYIAENAEEVEHTCQFHRSRAMHELHKEARLRKIPLPDLLGQLRLRT